MRNSQARMTFIFVTILLDAIGIGLVVPILPEVIRRFGSDEAFVSTFYGYFISLYSFMLFFASPLLGSLSDRFGRRPVLLIALCGSGLDYLLMAFAPNLTILFIGRVISGLTGASITVASSYIADVSTDKNRTQNFGMIGAAFGLGFVIGPAIGGIIGSFGHNWPFILAAIMSLTNFIFGLFVLPESLPAEKRKTRIDKSQLNPIRSVITAMFYSPAAILIWAFFLTNLAGQSHPSIWALFTHYKFQWNSMEIGISLTVVGIAFGLGQGFTTRIVTPKIGELKSVIYGLIVLVANFLLYALVTKSWMLYAATSLLLFTSIVMPSLQSMITKGTPSEEQGELQGTLVAITSLTSIIGPLVYTGLFSFFTKKDHYPLPGAPYIAAAAFTLVCLFLVLKGRHKIREQSTN
ncbi:DHA1 family tetracycline resistance protein-like MFS transporter [Bacteriovorax stolpii]|nr:TCR/Tet family MFS transporter [Bacteriovorax stolpii]TDP50973.1 DHA1 family tetracycline resistance protein-like MFS transporter [Bacteriovorax stolpii]